MLRNLMLLAFMGVAFISKSQSNTLTRQLAPGLHKMIQEFQPDDSLTISLSLAQPLKNFPFKKWQVLHTYQQGHMVAVRIRRIDLDTLLAKAGFHFLQTSQQPKEELTTGAVDYSLNQIRYVRRAFPEINGNTIAVSVKERLFDTLDIDLKNRVFSTGLENNQQTSHASLMATIIGGAGNSSLLARGAAPSSKLSSSSFSNLFPDNDAVLQHHQITVQNHSYGTIPEPFYGNEAMAYDLQSYNLPSLLHVFSAGNSGNLTPASGAYAGITEVSNLSGNFKQAKNILTVSATDSTGAILPLSSKGPAYDGRVKPELTAYGEDGSSGAAALVSGTAVLVQDALRRAGTGKEASSALVKSILINSADDSGVPEVDFATGYGKLNAFRAVEAALQKRFDEDSLRQDEMRSYKINVPAGIARLKITLVWTDLPAQVNAAKALVNDLDALLRADASGESWQPWVLSSQPVKDSLLLPARRGTDTLNTVEQITLENPGEGVFSFIVKGTHVLGSQHFAFSYQLDTALSFHFSYPTVDDPQLAGSRHFVRWETPYKGSATLDYTADGATWKNLATLPDLSVGLWKWSLPDTVAILRLRMHIPGSADLFSDPFTVSPEVNVAVGFNCVDSFLLYWNQIGSDQYLLYELEGNELAPFAMVNKPEALLYKQQHGSDYFAIAPVINGLTGFRSTTINYPEAGVGCYVKSFFLQDQTGASATFKAELGSLYDVVSVTLEKYRDTGYQAQITRTMPASLEFDFTDMNLSQGENRYRLKILLSNGSAIYSATETAFYTGEGKRVILYPNPVRQGTSLRILSNQSGRYSISIIDRNGKLCFHQELTSTVTFFNPGFLPTGFYLVRVADREGKTFTEKLIIY